MSGQTIDKTTNLIGVLLLISVLFFPDITVSKNLPSFQLSDFIVPILMIFLFIKKGYLLLKFYSYFILLFIGYILFTILINLSINSISDYLEMYKFFKYLIVLLFILILDVNFFISKVLKPIFILLVIVNLVHFFELFGINRIIEKYYNGGLNITYFGRNTLGELTSKRMVGLIGNPNNNALLFLFFSSAFFCLNKSKENLIYFLIAMTMTFMCQSRTILICVGVLILFFSIYKTIHSKKELWSYLFIIVASYFIAWMLSSRFFTVDIYSNSLFNGVGIKSNSVLGRIESWKFIGKHIFQKPLFGHGPNKSFFYTKNLYSENEYILYMYRYGVIGLIFYLGIFLFPIWRFYKKIKLNTNNLLIIPILIILVSALTNNPFTERNIQIVFCFFFGFCLQTLIRKNDSQKI